MAAFRFQSTQPQINRMRIGWPVLRTHRHHRHRKNWPYKRPTHHSWWTISMTHLCRAWVLAFWSPAFVHSFGQQQNSPHIIDEPFRPPFAMQHPISIPLTLKIAIVTWNCKQLPHFDVSPLIHAAVLLLPKIWFRCHACAFTENVIHWFLLFIFDKFCLFSIQPCSGVRRKSVLI